MAHADYDCCAICDCKIHYNGGGGDAKDSICPECIERTAELGHLCVRPAQFLAHLKTLDNAGALKWLRDLGFSQCFYGNEIDDYLTERGLIAQLKVA